LPTRMYLDQPITVDYLSNQLRALTMLFDGRVPAFKDCKKIVLPQICDGPLFRWETDKDGKKNKVLIEHPIKLWVSFKKYLDIYLDDRFTVITGKEGIVT